MMELSSVCPHNIDILLCMETACLYFGGFDETKPLSHIEREQTVPGGVYHRLVHRGHASEVSPMTRIAIIGTRRSDSDLSDGYEHREFVQYLGPDNLNGEGVPKSRTEIYTELYLERKRWEAGLED